MKNEFYKSLKLVLICLICSICFLSCKNVRALESYQNKNGVNVTQKEFNFIKEFYGDDYFDEMTLEGYEWLADLNINNSNVDIKKSETPFISTYSTSLTYLNKQIIIAKTCSVNCTILVKVNWLQTPAIKSYDVIGARLQSTALVGNNVFTRVFSTSGTSYYTSRDLFDNGFGTSISLQNTGSNINIEQKFTVQKGGTVYASYQHSVESITELVSKSYNIDSSGYGGVFNFTGNAIGKFDAMPGVEI